MSEFLDIHALADEQLSAEEATRLQSAMQSNPQLSAEYHSVLLLKTTLKRGCQNQHDEACWQACRARLNALERSDRAGNFVARYGWAMCGSLVLLIGAAGVISRQSGARTMDPSQISQYASVLNGGSRDATAERYNDWLNRSWQVKDVAGGTYNGLQIVRYDLADNFGNFSLYVIPGVSRIEGSDRGQCFRQVHGQNCVSWVSNGTGLMIVGSRSQSELQALAEKLQR